MDFINIAMYFISLNKRVTFVISVVLLCFLYYLSVTSAHKLNQHLKDYGQVTQATVENKSENHGRSVYYHLTLFFVAGGKDYHVEDADVDKTVYLSATIGSSIPIIFNSQDPREFQLGTKPGEKYTINK